MEKEVAELQESTNLFDVTIPDFRDIKLCRREIMVLKELWDIVVFVQVSTLPYFEYLNVTILQEIEIQPMTISSCQYNTLITQYLDQHCPLGGCH